MYACDVDSFDISILHPPDPCLARAFQILITC